MVFILKSYTLAYMNDKCIFMFIVFYSLNQKDKIWHSQPKVTFLESETMKSFQRRDIHL